MNIKKQYNYATMSVYFNFLSFLGMSFVYDEFRFAELNTLGNISIIALILGVLCLMQKKYLTSVVLAAFNFGIFITSSYIYYIML